MEGVRIIEAGPFATVQDLGRFGYQDRGVPVSGAMDRLALRIANLLVGNDDSDAGIEITLGGFRVESLGSIHFAVTGAEQEAMLNGRPIAGWTAHEAAKGDVLELGYPKSGCRSYLAVSGGIDAPLVMDSRSTYLRGGFGGYKGRSLQKGDLLDCGEPSPVMVPEFPLELIPEYSQSPSLRVVLGPQDDYFSEDGISMFLTECYRVTGRSDRMGYMLDGPAIIHSRGADIISDGTVMGAVQVPGSGQPTILMADCQTTGGYVKIASVASFDLPKVAQLLPGACVRFEAIGLIEAREIHLKREFMLRKFFEKCLSKGRKAERNMK